MPRRGTRRRGMSGCIASSSAAFLGRGVALPLILLRLVSLSGTGPSSMLRLPSAYRDASGLLAFCGSSTGWGRRMPGLRPAGVCSPHIRKAEASASTSRTASGVANTSEILLEQWRVLPDGSFRGALQDGVVIEFQGELVGPSDPGIVVGKNGARYVLGQPATQLDQPVEDAGAVSVPNQVLLALAGLGAALGLAGAVANTSVLQPPGPVTKTNVTIVESRKTLPDGKTVKVIEKTVKREKTKPGSAPVVTETNTRTEKELRSR